MKKNTKISLLVGGIAVVLIGVIGITFAFFKIDIISAIISIGLIAFILSILGVKIGNKFGERYERKSEIAGGVILILIGTKILLEHLGFIV